jgi:hypothetical protein
MINLLPKQVEDNIIMELQFITEAFADHFSSIFNSSSFVNTLNNSDFTYSDFLNIQCISDSDIKRAISQLHFMKCVGPDEIPIIKGCSDILLLFYIIFSITLLAGKFPSLWKQVAAVPIFKKDNRVLIINLPQF